MENKEKWNKGKIKKYKSKIKENERKNKWQLKKT